MGIVVVICVCLLINALFACFEMAFVSVTKPELKKCNTSAARRVMRLRANPERTLSTIQIGITLVGMISAAVGGAGAEESLGPILQNYFQWTEQTAAAVAIVIVVVPLTLVSVIVGELVPKTIALRDPLRISVIAARWISIFEKCVSPIVTLLEMTTKVLLLPFPKSRRAEEIESPTLEIEALSHQTRQYVLNLVAVERMKARDVMVTWDKVLTVAYDMTLSDVTACTISSGHTRLPAVKDGQVIGMLHTKEFIALLSTGESGEWQKLIRPVVEASEGSLALRVLRAMQTQRSHLCVVRNKENYPVGILTVEDVLEKVVGEIFDEDDDGRVRRILSSGSRFKSFFRQR